MPGRVCVTEGCGKTAAGTNLKCTVKGHWFLPIGGHETCPWADTNVPVSGHETAHRAAQISGVVPVPARA